VGDSSSYEDRFEGSWENMSENRAPGEVLGESLCMLKGWFGGKLLQVGDSSKDEGRLEGVLGHE
jgi:hypothetical protein